MTEEELLQARARLEKAKELKHLIKQVKDMLKLRCRSDNQLCIGINRCTPHTFYGDECLVDDVMRALSNYKERLGAQFKAL